MKSFWPLCLLALVLHVGTVAGTFYLRWDRLTGDVGDAAPSGAGHGAATAHRAPLKLGSREWDFWTPEINEMVQGLRTERERVEARGRELDALAARLERERGELDGVRREVTRIREEIDRATAELTANEAQNLRTVAQTYAKLTPRGAVAVFREMDDYTVLKILALMKPEGVSAIFEEMARTADKGGAPMSARVALLTEKLRLLKTTPNKKSPSSPSPSATAAAATTAAR